MQSILYLATACMYSIKQMTGYHIILRLQFSSSIAFNNLSRPVPLNSDDVKAAAG